MSTISAGVTVPTALNLSGDTTGALTFQVSGTVTAATITAAGNFGIGTASPSYPLHVAGNTNAVLAMAVQNSSTGSGAYSFVRVGNDTDATAGVLRMSSTNTGYSGANSLCLFMQGAYPIGFVTNNAERMRITSDGNVGIGTIPSSIVRFDIYGRTSAAGSYTVAFRNSSATNLFYIEDHGAIFTGGAANSPYNLTTGNAANVFVNSDGGLYRSTSSLRYKADITDAAHGLTDVLKLRSVTYKATNSGDTVFGGLIAEEVHDAGLTEFVSYDKEGRPDALHYGNMVALLVKAVQELKAENDALKARIEALESK